jgi:hypothetical protein
MDNMLPMHQEQEIRVPEAHLGKRHYFAVDSIAAHG